MMKKIICSYLLALHLCAFSSAQNAKEDFSKINATLMGAGNLLMETEYRVYENHLSKIPKEVSYGVIKQKDNKLYQHISTVQALMNDKYTVHLDSSERILVISDPVKLGEQRKLAMQVDLNTLLSQCKSIAFKEISKIDGVYLLAYKDDAVTEFDNCEIYFDRKAFVVKKMVLYYSDKMQLDDDKPEEKGQEPKLEIIFKKIDTQAVFKDGEFDEKRFVETKGNKLTAASRYKGFRVIDNRYNR